jgi:hypothetical protein
MINCRQTKKKNGIAIRFFLSDDFYQKVFETGISKKYSICYQQVYRGIWNVNESMGKFRNFSCGQKIQEHKQMKDLKGL